MNTLKKPQSNFLEKGMHRRKFFGYVAGAAGAATILAACDKNNDGSSNGGVDLGSKDTGILNYAYALEQLEAAFYIQVCTSFYSGATVSEKAMLADIRDHEVAHREFFKTALAGSAIPALEVNFATIDFTSRASVLGTAKVFEDLGVSAYNGAGKLIEDANYLLVAGKIVSVEARHAAYIRDLLAEGSFADSTAINTMGLDMANDPPTVLAAASAYIKTKIDASHLPTS